ncbi:MULTISPECIES: MFS transporter [Pseudonocardia]|uniref:Multidrug efflux system protein MdtL n=2 Tax=Pseudonocardia TaxID=1847 RepID=A0A1Y2N0Q7_PSEAH|nr:MULTISPECIES: MFS transporter [Pseudonocardia]OSY40687.1 multidrug efflux system protein MdtL [Pseudonocardia autotrophica]TDN72004.1 putative MFS family arabinose efflux permease [Pseudonocardia autotrophica]BBG02693.1 MFS transporter [Pseudonocardia autotrophica]GEC29382.1 MFS transporter [Pseudonocardia saturnea]
MFRSRSRPTAFATASLAFVVVCGVAGVPAPLYVVYQQAYGISTVALTGAFAVYIVPLLIALLCCGSLSDHVGRRRVAVPALIIGAVACLVLTTVDSALPLIVGRAIQGASVGLALGALGAYVVDLAPPARPGLAGAITSGAPPGGIALGALASGAAVQLAPDGAPVWSFVTAAGLLVVAAGALALLPETAARRPGALRSLRPEVRVPAAARGVFPMVCLVVAATYVLGGFTQALAPSLAAFVLGRDDLFSGAMAVAVYHLAGPAAGLAAARLPAARALTGGAAVLATGAAGFVGAIAIGSFAAYLAAAVVAGAGFGVAFAGAMRVLLARSPAGAHAGTLAAVYLYCYLAAAVASLLAGAAVDVWGLAPVASALCGVVVVMLAVGAVGSARWLRTG